jgi:serine protease AprX
MNALASPRTPTRTTLRICATLLLLLTLLLTTMPPVLAQATAPRAHSALLALAAERPDARVGVIIQKQAAAAGIEAAAVQLGGVVTHDLHFINAFAAQLSGRAALRLARMPGVRWVALDASVSTSAGCTQCISTASLIGAYTKSIGASRLWNEGPSYLQGQGVTVAVVDSGISEVSDLGYSNNGQSKRVLKAVAITTTMNGSSTVDFWGHGTHVTGIIGGDGNKSRGAHIGVAPKVNLVNVKVGDDKGMATTADVVAGLQWVYDHKDEYNIRVVNVSINATQPESYHTSAFNAAVELCWFKGIVVVVSGGNNGLTSNGVLYPPANDPFVITVGAADDKGTPDAVDDTLAPFSAYGITSDGFAKPDLVAPGTNIISLLASNSALLIKSHPDHRVDGFAGGKDYYFRMSGTSMASAVTAGAVALLLQDEPSLTPDQVKYRLKATARALNGSTAGYLDIYAAVKGTTTNSANTGLPISQVLATSAGSTNWGSANWGSANWGSANWGSVNWD